MALQNPETTDQTTALLKEHDNLQKQIAAFEKLLQHAMNRFSREKLFNMLKLLSKYMVTQGQIEADDPVHITSIEHLRSVIQSLAESHEGQPNARDDEKLLVHYFTAFFDDLQYLNQLKRYFDEKIYVFLYENFYDPLDDLQGNQDLAHNKDMNSSSRASPETNNNTPSIDTPIEAASPHPLQIRGVNNESKREESKLGEEEIVFDFLSKQAKLSHAVQKMYKVNKKWGNIMDESNPHLGSYDPDSKYELVSFSGSSRYEPVLRLLPDIFVKAYKSIEMAKLWWAHANKLYSGKPLPKSGLKEVKKQEVEIEHHIEKITEDIKRFEDTLVVRSEDLAKLGERETRFQALSDQCEKLEERKDKASQAYNTVLQQVQSIKEEIELYQKGTKQYAELEKRLADKDKQLTLTQDELKILAFHAHIAQEDFNLQMELQPHLMRFKAEIENKLTEIEGELKVKQSEKRETEKRLILLKANCEKMHEIMHRYSIAEGGDPASAPSSRENTELGQGQTQLGQGQKVTGSDDPKQNKDGGTSKGGGKVGVKSVPKGRVSRENSGLGQAQKGKTKGDKSDKDGVLGNKSEPKTQRTVVAPQSRRESEVQNVRRGSQAQKSELSRPRVKPDRRGSKPIKAK